MRILESGDVHVAKKFVDSVVKRLAEENLVAEKSKLFVNISRNLEVKAVRGKEKIYTISLSLNMMTDDDWKKLEKVTSEFGFTKTKLLGSVRLSDRPGNGLSSYIITNVFNQYGRQLEYCDTEIGVVEEKYMTESKSKLDKQADLERKRMGKKAEKEYNDSKRGASMGRPTVFKDKRFSQKYKDKFDESIDDTKDDSRSDIEMAWSYVCSGDRKGLDKMIEDGKPIETYTYQRFGTPHSLVMGAVRNNDIDTAKYLMGIGCKILPEETYEFYARVTGDRPNGVLYRYNK